MVYIKVLSVFCLIFMISSGARAQTHIHTGFCDQADSTAATQTCLKRHLQSAQKRLNAIYQKLNDKLEAEKLEELKTLQKSWLDYRDAECMWEAENSVTPSTKRLNELSCMARLTEDRADILTVVHGDEIPQSVRKEYGSFPRWMNVLAKDYSGILWDYGKRKSYDLNCNDEDEKIMIGFKTDNVDSSEEQQSHLYSKELMVAIVEDQPVGRPEATILTFPVQKQDGEENICKDDVSLGFTSETAEPVEGDEEQKTEQACLTKMTVSAKGCEPKTILWTGKSYALEIKEAPEESAKE